MTKKPAAKAATPKRKASGVPSAEAFAPYVALQGFNINGFDAWLAALEPCGAKDELTARRAMALQAFLEWNEEATLRHLEWMLLRWTHLVRVARLLPGAIATQQRSELFAEVRALGTATARQYTEADKQTWRDMIAADVQLQALRKRSCRACALKIAQNLRLPHGAFETIRKVI